mmetsp:Transcript_1757/g.4450  ORF Transcript_1757/g.4450 Transcript_1757/m.4450 type:complete len:450 (+) Transcript_1757:750-2099(+)
MDRLHSSSATSSSGTSAKPVTWNMQCSSCFASKCASSRAWERENSEPWSASSSWASASLRATRFSRTALWIAGDRCSRWSSKYRSRFSAQLVSASGCRFSESGTRAQAGTPSSLSSSSCGELARLDCTCSHDVASDSSSSSSSELRSRSGSGTRTRPSVRRATLATLSHGKGKSTPCTRWGESTRCAGETVSRLSTQKSFATSSARRRTRDPTSPGSSGSAPSGSLAEKPQNTEEIPWPSFAEGGSSRFRFEIGLASLRDNSAVPVEAGEEGVASAAGEAVSRAGAAAISPCKRAKLASSSESGKPSRRRLAVLHSSATTSGLGAAAASSSNAARRLARPDRSVATSAHGRADEGTDLEDPPCAARLGAREEDDLPPLAWPTVRFARISSHSVRASLASSSAMGSLCGGDAKAPLAGRALNSSSKFFSSSWSARRFRWTASRRWLILVA